MLKYRVDFSDDFEYDFRKLSSEYKKITLRKIARLEQNPWHPSLRTQKLKGHIGLYESSVNMSIRIIWEFDDDLSGDCRIIITRLEVGRHDILKRY